MGKVEEVKDLSVYYDNLLKYTNDLNKSEDIQTQIQLCTPIILCIKNILGSLPKVKDNYTRKLLTIYSIAIRKSCGENLYNEKYLSLFEEIAVLCSLNEVSESDYYMIDNKLYGCGIVITEM